MAARELPVSVALAGLSASVALTFGAVFASTAYVAPLVAAAVLPHLLGWLTRRWTRSGIASALVSGAGFVVAAVAWSGSLAAVRDDLSNGWHVLWHDVRPIPATHGAVLLLGLVVFVVGAVTDDLAFRRDGSVVVLAPPIVAVIWLRALGRTGGWLASTLLFGASGVAFLALQHQALLARRRTRVGRSARGLTLRLVAGVALAGMAATLAASALASALPLPSQPIGPVGNLLNTTPNPANASYSAGIPPQVDVGDLLRQGTRRELFTVAADTPAYWRTTSLEEYSSANGGEWTLKASGSGAVGQGLSGRAPVGALHQQYAIGPLGERWMPAAFEPVRVSRPGTLVVRASGTLVADQSSVQGLAYTVDSRLPAAVPTLAQQLATAAAVPSSLRQYLSLPSDVPAVVRSTARSVTATSTLPYDQARALRDYFRSQFTYDASVRLGDDEAAMATFLSTRRGFCVQFAATYAVMARSLGIPSRLAVGFTPGTKVGGVYHVTNLDAHAWPEIWLAGIGWTDLFDPTPRTTDPGASARPSEPPVSVSRPTSTPTTVPATATPSPGSTGRGTPSPTPSPAPNRVTVSRPSPSSGISALGWVLVILGVVAVGILAALVTAMARKTRRRARRRAAPDPADQVAGAWAEALDGLRAARVAWPSSLTPYEVAEQVPARVGDRLADPLGALAHRYTTARYGAVPPSPEVVEAAWRDTDAVLAALHASVDLPTRLRARLRVGAVPGQPEPAGWSERRRPSTND